MTGQARALTEPMAKEMATAATALSFDEAFTPITVQSFVLRARWYVTLLWLKT